MAAQTLTEQVHDYWNRESCGTSKTAAEKFSRAYFDEIEQYRYRYNPWIPEFAQFVEWRGKRVLEIGVGAGTDFIQFVRAGADMHGVDLTEEAVANVAHRLQVYNLSATDLRVHNAEHLPFDDNFFDLVWSCGVIHHADNTEQCLREIARVTKPGGSVKIMIYNLDSVLAWGKSIAYGLFDRRRAMRERQESPGTKAYTEVEARAMAARCGLTVKAITYAEQGIPQGAKLGAVRRLVQQHMPSNWKFFLNMDMAKPN